jgi:hypothetical protein
MIAELRRMVQQYEQENDQTLKWRRQMPTLSSLFETMFQFGQKSHLIWSKLFDGIIASESETIQQLRELEDFQRVLLAQEDSIIFSTTSIIHSAFPMGEDPPPQKRVLASEDSVWQVTPQITALFFEMRSFVGASQVVPIEMVPKQPHEGEETPVLFARVWANWSADGDALTVKKRETVQILQTPATPYWPCQNVLGEKGYLPVTILEIVE